MTDGLTKCNSNTLNFPNWDQKLLNWYVWSAVYAYATFVRMHVGGERREEGSMFIVIDCGWFYESLH